MENYLENLICRYLFNAQDLVESYPAKLKNANKKIVYQIACDPDSIHNGEIIFSRWNAMSLPLIFSASDFQTKLEQRQSYFTYEASNQDIARVDWYLNFSHSDLFCAYGSALFAQDEMQVAEHPALASLREALLGNGIDPLTVEAGNPTPITIRGVERRCAISTEPNADQGRPYGLYGNNFARATPEAIKLATKPLDPPTLTNIIAMEAPPGGYGSYTMSDITYIIVTAFTGFLAAKLDSFSKSNPKAATVIHTGFWGCGAYGGNRVLMALLQILAARIAKVNCLVFYTGNAMGSRDLQTAEEILNDIAPVGSSIEVKILLGKIHEMEFKWGVSDGN